MHLPSQTILRTAIALFGFAASAVAQTPGTCRDVKFINGRIHTMSAGNTVVSSVTIHDGHFAEPSARINPCARTINLHGRTAVPGLVDNHNHIVLLGLRPGHDTRLETAASIADVQSALAARAKAVPQGEWITAMGGWNQAQFKEHRLPTLVELDAADTNRPRWTIDSRSYFILSRR